MPAKGGQDGSIELASHIPRVQASCDRSVGCAFDNGAAVGEECHLVRIVPELQDEVVVAHGAVGLETAIEFSEVDGALALMNLHRIPAA